MSVWCVASVIINTPFFVPIEQAEESTELAESVSAEVDRCVITVLSGPQPGPPVSTASWAGGWNCRAGTSHHDLQPLLLA